LRDGVTSVANLPSSTGAQLALAWDKQFGLLQSPDTRIRQIAELTVVANSFLGWLTAELHHLPHTHA